jgi:hypothetical protein
MTIHSGGTFAPGVPGTFMQISGTLTLQSAAIYMVTINGANTSGVNVTGAPGSATIDSGALAKANTSSTPIIGTKYTILTATSVSGTFADPTFFFGRYEGVLSYDANDVFLTVQNGSLLPLLPPGAPINVINIANGIDNAIANGAPIPAGFQNIFNFTPAQIVNALTQLEGQPATDVGNGAALLMTDFLNLLNDEASGAGGGGGDGTGGGATGFADEQQSSLPPDVALAYNNALKKPQPQNFEQRWSAWGSAYGGNASYNGNAAIGSNNVTASDFGFAGGMNYHVTPNTVYGFALAGGGTNWILSQNLGQGRSDALQAGAMARRRGARCTCLACSLLPIIGSQQTALRWATSSMPNSMGRAMRRAVRRAIASR